MNDIKNDIRTIITDPNGAEVLVSSANQIGQDLKSLNMTTSQIRALFGEVRLIQSMWKMGGERRQRALRRLILLRPKMAYRAKKERGKGVQELASILEKAIDEVVKERQADKQNGNFERFMDYFEAILAYHKAYGGS